MTPLRARMIADMSGRSLGPASQTSHLRTCKRFAAWLGRSPEMATPDDVKYFQQHLIESGTSICTRNRTMTGVKFLFRMTLRHHDLVAETFHLKEPVKVPLVLSKKEIKRILAMAPSLKVRVMLSLAYGCGMRAGEVVRLKVGDIDSAQQIIRIVPANITAVQADRAGSRDHQAGHAAHVTAQSCHSPAGARRGYQGHTGAAGTYQTHNDSAVCQRRHGDDRGSGQPIG